MIVISDYTGSMWKQLYVCLMCFLFVFLDDGMVQRERLPTGKTKHDLISMCSLLPCTLTVFSFLCLSPIISTFP